MKKELITTLLLAMASYFLMAAKPTDYAWFTNSEHDEDGNPVYFEPPDTASGPIRSNDTFFFRDATVYGRIISAQDTLIAEGENFFQFEPDLNADSMIVWDGLCQNLRTYATPFIISRNHRLMTWIQLRGDAGIRIYQYPLGGVPAESLTHSLPVPSWQKIFVDGPVEIEGALTGALIVGASDNIYLINDVRYTRANQFTGDFNEDDRSVGMLGLVSEKNIIIKNTLRNGKDDGRNRERNDWDRHSIVITAALVCPDGSFTFEDQNWDWEMYQGPTPDYRGMIYLKGCVIQNRRGRLHTDNHEFTGYGLALRYDFRFLQWPPVPFEPERSYLVQGNWEELTLDTYHRYTIADADIRRLTIPAGANVNFLNGSRLTIRESLDIIGHPDTLVVLKPDRENIRAEIVMEGVHGSSVHLSHLQVREGITLVVMSDSILIDNSDFSSTVELSGGVNVESSTFREPVIIRQTDRGEVRRGTILNGIEIKTQCANLRLLNNTIIGSRYDGVVIDGGENIVLTNNIIANNRQGVYLRSLDHVDLRYNLVWYNRRFDYVGLEAGANDLSRDPIFVNERKGDYRLRENSPCINAGDPDSPRDPDGTRADIGAFYFDHELAVGNTPPASRGGKMALSASPNPFNSTTVIRLNAGPINREATIRIYDLSGREVFTTAASPQVAAKEQSTVTYGEVTAGLVSWDASAFPAGIYIVCLEAGREQDVIKLVKVD